MMSFRQYSDYFTTIYDEPAPVGPLMHGKHYSVLRYASWFDDELKPQDQPLTHDFAIIWDEDHDLRIILAIENIYTAGLQSTVVAVGETQGTLFIDVAAQFYQSRTKVGWKKYNERLEGIFDDIEGDVWTPQVSVYDSSHPCDGSRDSIYLRNIDTMWGLQPKPFHR